jgi:hypothetical protein
MQGAAASGTLHHCLSSVGAEHAQLVKALCRSMLTPHAMLPPSSQVLYNGKSMRKARGQWRSREFGFVDFASLQEAALAVAKFNGKVLPGFSKGASPLAVQFVTGECAALVQAASIAAGIVPMPSAALPVH